MRLGIVGGGQLARMLSLAAHRLDIEPWFVDPSPDAPAAAVARQIRGRFDDEACLAALARCDVATAEFDHAPVAALNWLEKRIPVRPGPGAFSVAGDRLREKRSFARLGIASARYAAVGSTMERDAAFERIGAPSVLKTRFEGYDGRGQRSVSSREDLEAAWVALGQVPAILEEKVPFEREISFLAARGTTGEVRFWSPVENRHEDGILRESRPLALAPTDPLCRAGEEAVGELLRDLDYVGVLAVEFFDVQGTLVANEMACRVHNSGHWTEAGAATSQFENHVRAVCGLPLGDTRLLGPTALVNLIGEAPPRADLLALPGARLHLYGKQPRPGRKVGHLTLCAPDAEHLDDALRRLRAS